MFIDWEKVKERCQWDGRAKLTNVSAVFEIWGLSNITLGVKISFIGITRAGSAG